MQGKSDEKDPAQVPENEGEEAAQKDVQSVITSAAKVKSLFLRTSHAALDVMNQIETMVSWSWARAKELPALKQMVNELKAELSPWCREFLLEQDMNLICRNNTTERVKVELSSFVNLNPRIEKVAKQVQNLLSAKKLLEK